MIETPEDRCYLVELDEGVLRLTFNRPEFGNSMPWTAAAGLLGLFRAAQADPSVRCILIAGNGKVFAAGGDVVGFSRTLDLDVAARQADFAQRLTILTDLVTAVLAFDRPIVAAVRGAAAGASLLYPLSADYVLGDETAAFVFAHQRVGLTPDGGVSALLPRVVGERTARTLLLTAAKVDAAEAYRLGILTRIVQPEELETESLKIARRFAQAPQTAITGAKRLVMAAGTRPMAAHLAAEAESIVNCVADPDFAEGVRAFIEKRAPSFPSAANDRR